MDEIFAFCIGIIEEMIDLRLVMCMKCMVMVCIFLILFSYNFFRNTRLSLATIFELLFCLPSFQNNNLRDIFLIILEVDDCCLQKVDGEILKEIVASVLSCKTSRRFLKKFQRDT